MLQCDQSLVGYASFSPQSQSLKQVLHGDKSQLYLHPIQNRAEQKKKLTTVSKEQHLFEIEIYIM